MIAWAPDPDVPDAYPDRHLHLADLLQEVPRQEQAAGDAGPRQVRPDRGTEGRRERSATSRCPTAVVAKATAAHPEPHGAVEASVASCPADVAASHVGAAAGRAVRRAAGRDRPGAEPGASSLIDRAFRATCRRLRGSSRSRSSRSSCCGSRSPRRRRSSDTASASSPAACGIRTPSATASSPRCGERSTPRCSRWCSARAFGVAAAIFLSEGYLGQAAFAAAAPHGPAPASACGDGCPISSSACSRT